MRSNKGLGRSRARWVREEKYLNELENSAANFEECPYHQRQANKIRGLRPHKVVVSEADVNQSIRKRATGHARKLIAAAIKYLRTNNL